MDSPMPPHSKSSPRSESRLSLEASCLLSLVSFPLVIVFSIWLPFAIFTGQWNIYRLMDEHGWIEHEHDTPVWIQGEWLPDEYRACEMSGKLWGDLPEHAHLLCGIGDPKAIEGKFHILPVHYWGRIDRTDQTDFSWRCQKESIGLVCKALN